MIEFIKKYWFIIALVGFLVTCSSNILAIWASPEVEDERWERTQDQFQQTYQAQQDYFSQQASYQAIQEERYEQQQQINERYFEWLRELDG